MNVISEAYRNQQKALHRNVIYGKASVGYSPLIVDILKKTGIREITDYGAGKCRLNFELRKYFKKIDYYPYDPAFPEYGNPIPAELVVCIDVLEHIEDAYLENVLNELASITKHLALFTIHTGPAKKVLQDGRNAHLIQQPIHWWLDKLTPFFDVVQLTPVRKGFWVLLKAKNKSIPSSLFQHKPKLSLARKLMKLFHIKSN